MHGAGIYANMDPINIPPINVSINIPAPWILWDMIYVIPILDSPCNKKDVLYLFYPIIFVLLPTFFGVFGRFGYLGVYLSILEEWGVNQENIIGT